MTGSEIRTMPIDKVIVIPNGGMKPLYCSVKPYYKIRKFNEAMEVSLPEEYEPRPSLNYTTQYLSLDKYITNKEADTEEKETNNNSKTQ
jgi:type IV secretory pathway TraG/TraD family ATPase VirD4